MAEYLTLDTAIDFLLLCFLLAVLGFDNLLHIATQSRRAPVPQQRAVRFWGIVLAIAIQIGLLFIVVRLLDLFPAPFATLAWTGVIEGAVNLATLVYLAGGVLLIHTAVKEIAHLLSLHDLSDDVDLRPGRSAAQLVAILIAVNLLFAVESLAVALALSDVLPVLAAAIAVSGLAMLILSDGVTRFLQKNRMLEVVGLHILLVVGVMLLGEAGVAAAGPDGAGALTLFGAPVEPLSKPVFYLAVLVLAGAQILQIRYARRLGLQRKALQRHS